MCVPCILSLVTGTCTMYAGADPGISKRGGGGGGPGAVEFFDLRFASMPLYKYTMFLLEE